MPARHLYILRIYIRESGKPSVRVIPTLSVGRLRTPPQRVRRIPAQYSRAGKEEKKKMTSEKMTITIPIMFFDHWMKDMPEIKTRERKGKIRSRDADVLSWMDKP